MGGVNGGLWLWGWCWLLHCDGDGISITVFVLTTMAICYNAPALQFYYLTNMGLDKNDIELLQKSLTPAQKKFNIMEVIQKFADNPHMHETFRQICLHYQSSSVSFKQIIQYLFGQFNRVSSEQQTIQKNKNKIRIKKNNQKQDIKIILLLKQRDNNNIERIKELVVGDRDRDLYAITNTSIREYNMDKEGFNQQLICLHQGVISRVGICGSLVVFVTAQQEVYLQVLPSKLQQPTTTSPYNTTNSNTNNSNSPTKNSINKTKNKVQPQKMDKYLIHKFNQQSVIFLSPLNQQQWVACTAHQITLICIPLTGQIHHISPSFKKLKISGGSEQVTILSVCKLSYPYIALITAQKTIMIVDMAKMKVTNSMCNDSNFTTFCYNSQANVLVAADFGGYLMALTFNQTFGDIEEQGIGIKKKTRQDPLPPENELFSTRYLQRKQKNAAKFSKNDSIFNKEVRTLFTTIVQNTFRNPIQILTTKQQTVFSYESQYHRSIKLWNLSTLQVYQKIELNLEIYDMKVCENGLYLISREKGYLCYYPFEEQDNANNKKQHTQVLQLCISSNMMFVNTTNMTDNVVYKLRLSNQPTLSEYARRQARNAQKSLKYAFYKNEVMLLNLMKTHTPTLEIYGIFGENKQIIKEVRNYHSMVRFPHKQGVILWSDRKVYIRCKLGHRPIIHKHYSKGQHIFESQPQNASKQKTYTQTITMSQPISKVKCFQNYITIICYVHNNQDQNSNKQSKKCQDQSFSTSNSYIIDENTMCLSYIFGNISKEYRIIQSHKHCSLIMKNQGSKGRKYFLYDHKNGRRLWKAEEIEGWIFQTVDMVNISSAKEVEIICVYKSKTITRNRQSPTKPIFYLIKTKISLAGEEKSFVNLSQSIVQAHSETQTIEQIKSRSIYHKIKTQDIQNSTEQYEQVGVKKNYKIFFPNSQILPKKIDDSELKLVQGKILHYQNDQGILMFGVILSGMAILYQMDTEIQAEMIGVLNFDKIGSQQGDANLKQCITYWNSKYKKDDEELWEQVKNNAIRRVKNKNISPLMLSRSDSLRSTNKKWNPQNQQQPFLPKISQKRSKSYAKIPPTLDPNRLNQLIYKHNIQENIVKEKQENQKKGTKNKAQPKSNQIEREAKGFSLHLKAVSQFKFESPSKISLQEPSTVAKSPLNLQKSLRTEQTEYQSKFHIIEKTLQQRKITKIKQPAILFSQQQNVPKLYNTTLKEDRAQIEGQRKSKQLSSQKLKTQCLITETPSPDSLLSPKKARLKTESHQVLPKSKNLQQPSIYRSNTRNSRASNYKSQSKLDQIKQLFGKKEQKKQITFDELIRQTNYPTQQTITNKISIKTQQSKITKKPRYKTQPQQQLQKSKLIEQSMVAHLPQAYKQSTRNEIYEKSLIFSMFNKQRHKMKQSLLNHNLHQHNKSKLKEIQEQIRVEVKQKLQDMEKIKKTYKLRHDTIN